MHFAESQCTSEQWNDEKKPANVFTMVLVHDDIKKITIALFKKIAILLQFLFTKRASENFCGIFFKLFKCA